MTRPEQLLHPTPRGLYCPPGEFYIDPVRKVDRALITHGHSDHARKGHDAVLATAPTLAFMQARYGENFARSRQIADYGERHVINGVDVRFFPAGHILGSAQIVVEHEGYRIICSGDYKRRQDPTCEAFRVEHCDVFITEATFALPVFRHPDDRDEIKKLLRSMSDFPQRTHLVGAYSLGKAQRVIALLREAGFDAPIHVTRPALELCDIYRRFGVELGELKLADSADDPDGVGVGGIVIGPSQTFSDRFIDRCNDSVIAFASGWMSIRSRAVAAGVELPLILSDHADWDELTKSVTEVNPDEFWITHGRHDALVRWAQIEGRIARPLSLIGYDD